MVLLFTCIFKIAIIHVITVVTQRHKNYFSLSVFFLLFVREEHMELEVTVKHEDWEISRFCARHICALILPHEYY